MRAVVPRADYLAAMNAAKYWQREALREAGLREAAAETFHAAEHLRFAEDSPLRGVVRNRENLEASVLELVHRCEKLRSEAQLHAQEARTARSQVREVARVLGVPTWNVTGNAVANAIERAADHGREELAR